MFVSLLTSSLTKLACTLTVDFLPWSHMDHCHPDSIGQSHVLMLMLKNGSALDSGTHPLLRKQHSIPDEPMELRPERGTMRVNNRQASLPLQDLPPARNNQIRFCGRGGSQ